MFEKLSDFELPRGSSVERVPLIEELRGFKGELRS